MPKQIILFAISVLISCAASARYASLSEVPMVIQSLKRDTQVSKDGTFIDKWSWRMKVQKRSARDDVGTRSVRFYKSFEEVKILRAGTLTDGKFKEIKVEDAQERAVTDESPGFSALSEYVLSFPNVQEGSVLEFDYEIKTRKALEPDFWGQSMDLDAGAYEAFQWTIHSEHPLVQFLQDPSGKIRATSANGDKDLKFVSKGKFSLAIADETEADMSNDRKILMMASFLSDWKNYGVYSAKQFELRAKDSLTKEDDRFAKNLQTKSDAPAKISAVLDRITGRLRYFGDWRTSEQMYVPRSLEEIARTDYGDCKDFALLASKMFRVAGLIAKPVWVLNADEAPAKELYRFPTDNSFNHVIVWVSDGKSEWWIDPTNPNSRVGFLADEIAGRPGLILGETGSELKQIRDVLPEDYRTTTTAEITGGTAELPQIRITTNYEGMSPITAGEQMKADGATSFFDEHLQRLMPAANVTKFKIESADFESKASELRGYKVTGNFENFWVRTSAGPGFSPVREDAIERVLSLKLADRAADIALGKVYSYDEDVIMNGYKRVGDAKLDCSVHSPWIDFAQTVNEQKEKVVYHSSYQLKKPELVLTEDNRAKALQLQKDLRNCAGRLLILLKPI